MNGRIECALELTAFVIAVVELDDPAAFTAAFDRLSERARTELISRGHVSEVSQFGFRAPASSLTAARTAVLEAAQEQAIVLLGTDSSREIVID